MGRALRIAALSLATVVLGLALAAGLVLAVAHGFARERLRGELELRLAEALGTPVAIQSLDGVLYREIDARGVRIGPEAARWIEAEHLGIAWKGVETFEWRANTLAVSLRRLTIEGARLRVVSGEAWPWQSDAEVPDEPTAIAFAFAVDEVLLPDATVEVVGPDGARLRAVGDASARAFRSDAAGTSVEALELAGRADTALRGSGPGLRELGRFEAAGAFAFESAADAPRAGAPSGTPAPDEELTWSVARFHLDGPVVQADGRGRGDAVGIATAVLDVSVASVTRLVAELAAFQAPGEEASALAKLEGGTLRGHLDVRGAWQTLAGELTLDAASLSIGDRRLGDLHLAVRSAGPEGAALERVAIEGMSLRGGELDLQMRRGALLELREDRIALQKLVLEIAQTGVATLSGSLPRAPWDADAWLRDPRLVVKIDAQALPLAELLALAPDVGKGLTLDDARLAAKLDLSGRAAGAVASGWVSTTASAVAFDGDRAEGLDLRLELAGPIARSKGRVRASATAVHATDRALGPVELSLAFANATDSADFEVELLEWSDASLPGRIVPGSRFQLRRTGVRLQDVRAESGEQRLRANGRVALLAGGGVALDELAIDVEVLSLPWVRERLREAGLLGPDVSVKGAVTGRLVLDGPIDAPAIESDLEIRAFSSAGVDFERVTFEAHSPTDRLAVLSHWDRNGATVLNASIDAPRRVLFSDPLALLEMPAARLEVVADHFDLAALEAFAPARVQALRGSLLANVAMRGGTPAQVERGSFELLGGSVRLSAPRQLIGPIAATGNLTTGAIEITRITIGPPEAQLVGDGRIDDLGSGDERLVGTLHFDHYPFKLAGLAKADLNGAVQVRGRLSAPRVEGRLVLSKVDIWLPDANAPELKEILVSSDSASGDGISITEGEEEPGALDRVAYDLSIELERGSWARGRGVEAELAGKLRLEKRAGGRESYSGEVHTVRGTYEVYGRRFQIDRGLATLDGAAKIDPALDILAKHRIRNVEIEAIVGGRLSDPTLRFESSPEMSETDIASYLLLGRPAATARGEDALAVQMTAARLAAGLVSSELDRLLAPILPVDVIDVRVDEQSDENALALGVGKYIGERLFLQYDRRFGRESVDELRAEYELTDRWSIESSAATNGEAGGDLIFNIEY